MAHYNKRNWDKKTSSSTRKSSGYQDKINDIRYYSKRDELDKAQALIDELRVEHRDDPSLIFEQAKVYQARGQIDKSEELFNNLITMNAGNALTAKYELARLYCHAHRGEEAKALCNSLLQARYKTDLVTCFLGNVALMEGNKAKAISYYKMAASTCEQAQFKLNSLSKSNCQNNLLEDYEKRVSVFNKGIVYWNDKIKNDIENSNIVLAINELPEYERAINKNFSEDELGPFIELILLTGKVNYAEEMINKYKSQCPEETSNYLYGRLAIVKGDYDHATRLFKNAKVGSNYFYASNYYLGLLAKQEHRDEVARGYFALSEKEQSTIGTLAIEQLLYMDIEHVDFVDATIQANKLKAMNNAGAIHVADQALEYISCNEGNPVSLEGDHYSFQQMKEYDVPLAIRHIKRHQDSEAGEEYSSCFNKNTNIREVYDYALDNLLPSNLCYYDLCHHYVIYYPNAAHINDKPVDYIEVVTLPVNKYGVRNILTMFPVRGRSSELVKVVTEGDKAPEVETKPKVKELSAIDKFNKRYGLKP